MERLRRLSTTKKVDDNSKEDFFLYEKWADIGDKPVKISSIYATRDYERFKFLEGNRDTNHFKKLIKSIKQIGVLYQPILINEKDEIIEGQGRFLALKALKLPVIYTKQNGIGINECRFLNSCSTNWNLKNYVHSYAIGSDTSEGARYLELLSKEFPGYGYGLLYGATTNNSTLCGHVTSDLKNGKIYITEEQYKYGREVMSYVDQFKFAFKVIQGRVECFQSALVYFYRHPDVDNEYLLDRVKSRYAIAIPPIANTAQAIEVLELIYNFNARSVKPIYIKSDFQKYSASRRKTR